MGGSAAVTDGPPTFVRWKETYLKPLKAAGFAKRPGGGWTLQNQLGDEAVVFASRARWNPNYAVELSILFGIIPEPYVDWLERAIGGRPTVGPGSGLYHRILESPQTSWLAPGIPMVNNHTWQYTTAEQAASLGSDLERMLANDVIPTLTRLLDRDAFLAHVRAHPNDDALRLHGLYAEVVLLSDLDRPTEIKKLLERFHPADPLAVWARSLLPGEHD
jgi:hypothetical protein